MPPPPTKMPSPPRFPFSMLLLALTMCVPSPIGGATSGAALERGAATAGGAAAAASSVAFAFAFPDPAGASVADADPRVRQSLSSIEGVAEADAADPSRRRRRLRTPPGHASTPKDGRPVGRRLWRGRDLRRDDAEGSVTKKMTTSNTKAKAAAEEEDKEEGSKEESAAAKVVAVGTTEAALPSAETAEATAPPAGGGGDAESHPSPSNTDSNGGDDAGGGGGDGDGGGGVRVPTVSTDRSSYGSPDGEGDDEGGEDASGKIVVVTFSDPGGAPGDWIGIYPPDAEMAAPDGETGTVVPHPSVDWVYLCGTVECAGGSDGDAGSGTTEKEATTVVESGSVEFRNLPPGRYRAFLSPDVDPPYPVLASSDPFDVYGTPKADEWGDEPTDEEEEELEEEAEALEEFLDGTSSSSEASSNWTEDGFGGGDAWYGGDEGEDGDENGDWYDEFSGGGDEWYVDEKGDDVEGEGEGEGWPVISTNRDTYSSGGGDDVVLVMFTNVDAAEDDWIGIYPLGSAEEAVMDDGAVAVVLPAGSSDWAYACGTKNCTGAVTSGNVTFPLSSLETGFYRAFIALNTAAPYPAVAASEPFEIVEGEGEGSDAGGDGEGGDGGDGEQPVAEGEPSVTAKKVGAEDTAPSPTLTAAPTGGKDDLEGRGFANGVTYAADIWQSRGPLLISGVGALVFVSVLCLYCNYARGRASNGRSQYGRINGAFA